MALVRLDEQPAGVATLTLSDPDRRNAMSLEMATEFRQTVNQLARRRDLRALILTGAGPAFSAGGDLNMLQQKAKLDPATNRADMLEFYESFLCLLKLPVPTIAAINGYAIGAGFCLALACEFRLAAAAAKLGLTFTRIGLHPGMGATLFLPRIAGAGVAHDLLISGRVVTANEAHQLRLVQQVVPDGELMAAANTLANSLLGAAPGAVSGLLKTLRPTAGELQSALEREAAEQARNYSSPEFREGLQAALEQRAPNFGGAD